MSFTIRSTRSAEINQPDEGATRETIGGLIVDWRDVRPTAAEVLAAHSPTPSQLAAQVAAAATTSATRIDPTHMRMRAESLQAFRAVKALLDRDAAWRAVFAAATNFADLKTRVAAMPPLPTLTRADWKAAVIAIMNADDPNG